MLVILKMKLWIGLFLIFAFAVCSIASIERICLEKHGHESQIEAAYDSDSASDDASKCHHQCACQLCHFGQYMVSASLINLESPEQKLVPPEYSALIQLHSPLGFFRPPIS